MAFTETETLSRCSGQGRDLGSGEGLCIVEESPDHLGERIDSVVAVISGDVVVELLPQSLDDVVIGRVRREEVKHDSPAEGLELTLHTMRLVDDVVVEHQVNAAGAPVTSRQESQELNEELSGLALGHAVDDAAVMRIERAEEVALDVLTWGEHDTLLPGLHVSGPDLRVEVNVGLVLVEDLVAGRRVARQFLYVLQRLASSRDRNPQPRTRSPAATSPAPKQLV